MDRFVRIEKILGKAECAWLRKKSATIVGIGAVGSYALEGLARAGIGKLRLVDFDRVNPSNINRQLHALMSTLGELKVEQAQKRVLDINPDCQVEALPLFADSSTLSDILEPTPDILIDAIDSLNSKFELLLQAHSRGIPVISSMGASLRTDPRQIFVDDLAQTKKCPLARKLRKQLRAAGVAQGITCVYSTEKVEFDYGKPEPYASAAALLPGQTTREKGRPRRVLGSLPTLPGIFGLTAANAALYKLLEHYDGSKADSAEEE